MKEKKKKKMKGVIVAILLVEVNSYELSLI